MTEYLRKEKAKDGGTQAILHSAIAFRFIQILRRCLVNDAETL